MFIGPCIVNIFQHTVYPTRCKFTLFIYIWKLLYMLRVVPPPIIMSATQLYLQHLVSVTPLLLPAAVAASSSNGVTNTRCCRYSCVALMMMGGGTTRSM
jgi:hypothetical protein